MSEQSKNKNLAVFAQNLCRGFYPMGAGEVVGVRDVNLEIPPGGEMVRG